MHWKNCNEIKASSRILHFLALFCLHFVMSSRQIVNSVWRLWRVGGKAAECGGGKSVSSE